MKTVRAGNEFPSLKGEREVVFDVKIHIDLGKLGDDFEVNKTQPTFASIICFLPLDLTGRWYKSVEGNNTD